MNSFSIYLPDFTNDLFNQFIVFASNSHWKYLKVGRWEINWILKQDSWKKVTLDKYVNGPDRFPKKECQKLTYNWSQIESEVELKEIFYILYFGFCCFFRYSINLTILLKFLWSIYWPVNRWNYWPVNRTTPICICRLHDIKISITKSRYKFAVVHYTVDFNIY